jgi:hypothetical protein
MEYFGTTSYFPLETPSDLSGDIGLPCVKHKMGLSVSATGILTFNGYYWESEKDIPYKVYYEPCQTHFDSYSYRYHTECNLTDWCPDQAIDWPPGTTNAEAYPFLCSGPPEGQPPPYLDLDTPEEGTFQLKFVLTKEDFFTPGCMTKGFYLLEDGVRQYIGPKNYNGVDGSYSVSCPFLYQHVFQHEVYFGNTRTLVLACWNGGVVWDDGTNYYYSKKCSPTLTVNGYNYCLPASGYIMISE